MPDKVQEAVVEERNNFGDYSVCGDDLTLAAKAAVLMYANGTAADRETMRRESNQALDVLRESCPNTLGPWLREASTSDANKIAPMLDANQVVVLYKNAMGSYTAVAIRGEWLSAHGVMEKIRLQVQGSKGWNINDHFSPAEALVAKIDGAGGW